jgi:hypothetical protein
MHISWTIETADYGTLTASSVEADALPTIAVGESVTLTFFFGPELSNHVADYNDLREFGRYSGDSIDTGTDIRGRTWYRERIHPYADYSTTLVKLTPGDDVGDLRSYWALVTDVTDDTQFVGAGERLSASCFILAEGSEYASRSDVEADLKADL